MSNSTLLLVGLAVLQPALCVAQRWELGIGAGAGIYPAKTITQGSQQYDAKLGTGLAGTAHIGQDMYRYIGGEVRYTWQSNDLSLTSGGTTSKVGAQSHAVEYDALFHFTDVDKTVRPYVLAGGGMKYYDPTGRSMFGSTGQWKPLVSAGAGVKFRLGNRTQFRVEARDSLSPFPDRLIRPLPSGGWINDYLVFAAISLLF